MIAERCTHNVPFEEACDDCAAVREQINAKRGEDFACSKFEDFLKGVSIASNLDDLRVYREHFAAAREEIRRGQHGDRCLSRRHVVGCRCDGCVTCDCTAVLR